MQWLHRVEDAVLAFLALALVVIAGAQIAARFFGAGGLLWADSLLKTLVLWLVMLGAMAAARSESHLGIDAFTHSMSPLLRRAARAIAFSFSAIVSLIACYYGYQLVLFERESPSDVLSLLPSWLVLSIIPIAFFGIALRMLGSAARAPKL